MLKELVLKNRSYRKFHAELSVSPEKLRSLVDLARNTPSSKNLQPLKYILVHDKPVSDRVFSCLGWAKHLKDWDGPSPEEQPPAYIIMLLDKTVSMEAGIDAGIAAQTILLGATESGLGGCIIRTVRRDVLMKFFGLPSTIEIIQVIAIGYPNQDIILTTLPESGSTHYFEEENIHYVPKRNIEDIIIDPFIS